MKKLVFLIISICFIVSGCSIKPEIIGEEQVKDSIDFKVEYENYNNSNYNLELDNENIFKYLTIDNYEKVFSTSTVIYMGKPNIDSSRYLVDNLIDISSSCENINIYYFDLINNEPKYEVIDNNLEKTKNQSELYNIVTDKLDNYVSALTVFGDDNYYKTDGKVFSNPTLVFIIDGMIYGYYDEFEFSEDNDKVVLDDLYLSLVKDEFNQICK